MNKPSRGLEKGQTFFLTSVFWKGFGGLFEFCKTLARYNLSTSGANADYHALYSDWEAVGGYLRSAASAEKLALPPKSPDENTEENNAR